MRAAPTPLLDDTQADPPVLAAARAAAAFDDLALSPHDAWVGHLVAPTF